MSILAECPTCHKKQKAKNKLCRCGEDLDKAKKTKRVRYWIDFKMGDGKHCRQAVGKFENLDPYSIEDARIADSKRRVQKKERRLLDIKKECQMTFNELTKWYLDMDRVKGLRSFASKKNDLDRFNEVFGDMVVGDLKPYHIESYQEQRKAEGKAPHTIDLQVCAAKSMINKAFDNDLIDGDVMRVFKKAKKLLRRNGNARKRILSPVEFEALYQNLPLHAKWVLGIGFYSGMRKREILSLTWDKVSLANRTISLEAKDTKDKEPREIPICDGLFSILKSIPRNLHDNHVILYCGRPIGDFRTGLIKACQKAKILYGKRIKDGFIFHDVRHSFNTYMRKAGVAESVIMEITGHSTREMFDRYDTIDAEDRREAVNKLEGFLRGSKEKVDQTVDQAAILG